MNSLSDIAKKLLEPANLLSQEGISATEYLTELTWLWFLKIAPAYGMATYGYFNWDVFISQAGQPQLEYYKKALTALSQAREPQITGLFTQAKTALQHPEQLARMAASLAVIDEIEIDDLGELYETLLELSSVQNAGNLPIVPRPLADMMVILTQPQFDEWVFDPLAGVGNLLVAADQYVQIVSVDDQEKSGYVDEIKESGRLGREPQLVYQRLALMNCLLHDFDSVEIPIESCSMRSSKRSFEINETRSSKRSFETDGTRSSKRSFETDETRSSKRSFDTIPPADVILSVLAFANEETCLSLLQRISEQLAPGGRAAVVVEDAILTAPGIAQQVRRQLLNNVVVHTVLRLPLGIFYPNPLLTHLLFFQKGATALEQTEKVWFYDMRSQFPAFGQHLQLAREHFRPFEILYGEDPWGHSPRQEDVKNGRWRCFNRHWLTQQEDKLSFSWLADKRTRPVKQRWRIWDNLMGELEGVERLLRC